MTPKGMASWYIILAYLKAGRLPAELVPQLRSTLATIERENAQLLRLNERAFDRSVGHPTSKAVGFDLVAISGIVKEAIKEVDNENWSEAAERMERIIPFLMRGPGGA